MDHLDFLPPQHHAIAIVARDLIMHGKAGLSYGKHRGPALRESDERSAALRQVRYVATHQGER